MKESLKKFSDIENCPIRNILDRFGDKWSMLVLLTLNEEHTLRFNELHKAIGNISQKMLTVTLKKLEADDLILRKAFLEVPPRVEYQLSERAKTLIPIILDLVSWANQNFKLIKKARKNYLE